MRIQQAVSFSVSELVWNRGVSSLKFYEGFQTYLSGKGFIKVSEYDQEIPQSH